MIKRITFNNYKAFESGELELRPLTFLLGANSSGKSSLLHLQLLLSQTISSKMNYSSALRTNGQYISMGEDVNLIKDRNLKNAVSFCFAVSLTGLAQLIKKYGETDNSLVIEWLRFLQVAEQDEFNHFYEKIKSELSKNEKAKKKDFLTRYFITSLYKQLSDSKEIDWDDFYLRLPLVDLQCVEELKNYLKPLIDSCSNFLTDSNRSMEANLCYEFKIDENSGRLQVSTCEIRVDDKLLLGFRNSSKGVASVNSEVFETDDFQTLIRKFPLALEFNALELVDNGRYISPFQNFVMEMFMSVYSGVCEQYNKNKVIYIGPLRANPERYYFLDDSDRNLDLNYKDANSLATILKNQTYIKDKINSWLNKFELSIDVKLFKDIINNVVVTQNSQSMDLTDVGFGISQILPILIAGFTGRKDSMTIMEQPEIHLHPKMQAELADLFIDIIKSSSDDGMINRCLLVETHSEYILKRIRRRIAEHSLSPNDVAIYFVDPRNRKNPESAIVRRIDIAQNGYIEWPKDFYETELNDDLAFFSLS